MKKLFLLLIGGLLMSSAQAKSLVAYFSLAGEQYAVGNISEGNTAIVAKMIAKETGADLFEIQREKPYPINDHHELLDVAKAEKSKNARPKIKGTLPKIAEYDTIYVGFPNWWADMPMIIYTFLESADFSGKVIVPFCTHGGSGFSSTERTIAGICKGAKMKKGLAISGTTAQNDRSRALKEVQQWLSKTK